ncbi:MAG: hypothetical protein ILP11_01335 [Alphaproteobacteria bacterium]|nr:hypothetical protein [Alphaproteobacteria bacterium]
MRIIFFCLTLLLSVSVAHAELYTQADRRGERASIEVAQDMPTLVHYLTEPFDSDKQKARALLSWIVYHIDYDDAQYQAYKKLTYKTKRGNQRFVKDWNTGDICVTRVGMCRDIAELYQRMLLMAGLDASVVTGDVDRGPHAWTAVKIDGKWLFVDPTWAMRGKKYIDSNETQSVQGHKHMVKQRQKGDKAALRKREGRSIADEWFLVSPQKMKQTHKPDDARWLNP